MRHVLWLAIVLVIASTATAQRIKRPIQPSGKPGEAVTPFSAIKAGGGADQNPPGSYVSYSSVYGEKPTLVIFTKKADDHLADAVKAINEALAADTTKRMCAYVVIFDKDRDVSEAAAKKFSKSHPSPLVPIVYPNGPDQAFRTFGVSQTTDSTIVTVIDNKVVTSHAGALLEASITRAIENLNHAVEEAKHRSGLKKDEILPPYYVTKLSGPDDDVQVGAGTSYRTVHMDKPHVVVVLRKIEPNIIDFLKQLDETVEKQEKRKLRAWVTLLGPMEPTTKLGKEMCAKYELRNLPITIAADEKGPPELKLTPEVEVTVMVADWDGKVIGNHVSSAADVDEAFVNRVLRDARNAEPKPPPRPVRGAGT
jgi:hypothetical protein